MPEATIPLDLFVLWRAALVVAYVVLLPTAVYWLHTLWRASNSIRQYARESADAAEAIARNTAALPALDATIAIASDVLNAAEAVAHKLEAAASALDARARG